MELAKGYREPDGYQTCTQCTVKKASPGEFNHYEPDCMGPTCNSCCWANAYTTLWSGTAVQSDPHTGKQKEGTKPPEKTKVCGSCQGNKPLSQYYDRKGSKDGKHYTCKACMKLSTLERRKIL